MDHSVNGSGTNHQCNLANLVDRPLSSLVSRATGKTQGLRFCPRISGQHPATGALPLTGCARRCAQGYPHLLARHRAVGPIAHPLWYSRHLHFEPPIFHGAIHLAVFQRPVWWRLFFQACQFHEPRCVRAEPRHVDHAFRLPAVFAGRQTPLDRRPLPTWIKPRGRSEVHASHRHFAGDFHSAHLAFKQHAAFADSPKSVFLRRHLRDGSGPERPRHGHGRDVPGSQGG